MTRDAIFALALALPGTEPDTSYGYACVKLRGKALLGDCSVPGAVALHLDLETVGRLVEAAPGTFYQTPHFIGWPTVLVRPAAADPEWLAGLVEQAWARRATKAQRRAGAGRRLRGSLCDRREVMLEKVPETLGKALAGVRAGLDRTLYEQEARLPATLRLTSPAFADGGTLDPRFTADGAGRSPPLAWDAPPSGTAELLLVVEDADSPTPQPIVHAIAHRLAAGAGTLAEGALDAGAATVPLGRNTFLKEGWLPPDPPTGHGDHRYCFQLFALGAEAKLPDHPGRGAARGAIAAHGLARGRLIGVYRRG